MLTPSFVLAYCMCGSTMADVFYIKPKAAGASLSAKSVALNQSASEAARDLNHRLAGAR